MNNAADQPFLQGGRILCIRPDNIGDVVMTGPALAHLKRCNPGAELTLLTSSAGKTIAPFLPCIDRTLAFDLPWLKHGAAESGRETRRNLADFIEFLAWENFQAAVIFTVYSQNPLPAAMLCYQAGIPAVGGYCRENPYDLISHWIPEEEPYDLIRHEVERQLLLAERLTGIRAENDCPEITVPARMLRQVLYRIAGRGLDPARPWLVLHPGVSERKRMYPEEGMKRVAARLAGEGVQVVLTGTKGESGLCRRIAEATGGRGINTAGELSPGELIALLHQAPLLLANNTGPVHIAAACRTPVLVLYALTNPQHTPWKTASRVLYFPVPSGLQSRNKVVEHAALKAFPAPASLPDPETVCREALAMLASGKKRVEFAVNGRQPAA